MYMYMYKYMYMYVYMYVYMYMHMLMCMCMYMYMIHMYMYMYRYMYRYMYMYVFANNSSVMMIDNNGTVISVTHHHSILLLFCLWITVPDVVILVRASMSRARSETLCVETLIHDISLERSSFKESGHRNVSRTCILYVYVSLAFSWRVKVSSCS